MGKEVSKDWKKTGYYVGGIVGLIAVDKITTKFLHNNLEPHLNYDLPNISFVNNTSSHKWLVGDNAYMSYPIMGIYLGSFFTNKEYYYKGTCLEKCPDGSIFDTNKDLTDCLNLPRLIFFSRN